MAASSSEGWNQYIDANLTQRSVQVTYSSDLVYCIQTVFLYWLKFIKCDVTNVNLPSTWMAIVFNKLRVLMFIYLKRVIASPMIVSNEWKMSRIKTHHCIVFFVRPRHSKPENESGFRPPLYTYRLNWARRISRGWWDDWDDTVLQTQDSKFEPGDLRPSTLPLGHGGSPQ